MRGYITSFLLLSTFLYAQEISLPSGKNYKILETKAIPSYESFSLAYFDFPEKKLMPGEGIFFQIPTQVTALPLLNITIAHRQLGRELQVGERDPFPGRTAVHIFDSHFPNSWRVWGKRKDGSKFADIRKTPEIDSFWDWPLWGHQPLGGGKISSLALRPKLIRVVSVGQDPIFLSKLIVQGHAGRAKTYKEYIFSPHTSFGDPLSFKGRHYGGGSHYAGKYPHALVLEYENDKKKNIDKFLSIERNRIEIQFPTPIHLKSLEIACGDTHPDGKKNRDGGIGTPGFSQLSFGIERIDGIEWMVKKSNIGPEGVLYGTPKNRHSIILPNEKIIIESHYRNDPVYIMGIRLGLD